jgi:hypothetical protein
MPVEVLLDRVPVALSITQEGPVVEGQVVGCLWICLFHGGMRTRPDLARAVAGRSKDLLHRGELVVDREFSSLPDTTDLTIGWFARETTAQNGRRGIERAGPPILIGQEGPL